MQRAKQIWLIQMGQQGGEDLTLNRLFLLAWLGQIIVSTFHFALPLSQLLYGWTNCLVTLGFLFTGCKIEKLILATDGNCLIRKLYAFVWALAYSWHKVIINTLSNTSTNVLWKLQKRQHPILNILNVRRYQQVIKRWHLVLSSNPWWCLFHLQSLSDIFAFNSQFHFIK